MRSHAPISWNLAVLIAATFAKQFCFQQAVATLLMHDCLLRVSEVCLLKVDDVGLPADLRLGSAQKRVVVSLRKTKTGRNQSVKVTNADVAALLEVLSRERRGHRRLFAFSPSQFRKQLRDVLGSLGLAHLRFSPHSFRHGGATQAYVDGSSVETILARGRWKSVPAARLYIQSGRALLLQQRIPPGLLQVAAALAAEPYRSLSVARSRAQ